MQSKLLFQYCQKLVILSSDKRAVLLAKRKDEVDYNGIFSFIGGKMETTDATMLDGMKREKNEEISTNANIKVLPNETYNILFRKKDGNSMILPHIAGYFVSGKITLNEEYSEYRWVSLTELENFEPKIDNILELTNWALSKLANSSENQFIEI